MNSPSPLPIKQRLAQADNVALVHRLLGAQPAPSRTRLAQELCRRLELRDPKGDWQIGTTAKALRELEAAGLWTLPPPLVPRPQAWSNAPTRLPQRVPPARGVPSELGQFEALELVEVLTRDQLLVWNELMIREHPLHDARLVGRQFRYLIRSEHGWLGGFGFGSAALYLESRDTHLGWSEAQRTTHLPRVINMTPAPRRALPPSRLARPRPVRAPHRRRLRAPPWPAPLADGELRRSFRV